MNNLDTLSIRNLNFEDIKYSFKQFLTQQNLFTDYNFEGSNFAILFDILAYNTYYLSMYQNFISSESWLDSALQRSSVVSHVKPLAYLPRTKKSAKYVCSISIQARSDDVSYSLTIPEFTVFLGGVYKFYNIEPIILTRNSEGYFVSSEPVTFFEGTKVVYRFIANTRNLYTIPFKDLDSSTLTVHVFDSLEFYERVKQTGDYSNVRVFYPAESLVGIDGTSDVFFLQEAISENYDLYFGDGVLGSQLITGSVIEVAFIAPTGTDANGIRYVEFSRTDLGNTSISGYTAIGIIPISNTSASFGGMDKQSIEDIKKYAPYHHEAQNRIVSLNDYYYFVNRYLGDVDKMTIWGGEENTPPRYGSVFCMIKPKNQERLSTFEKEALKKYIQGKSVVGLDFQVIDPNIVYIVPQLKIRYSSQLAKNTQLFFSRVDQAIQAFADFSLNTFRSSDLILFLKDRISAIRSITLRIKLMKQIVPIINSVSNYEIAFDTALVPGTLATLQNFSLDTSGTFVEQIFDNGGGLVFYSKIDSRSNQTFTTQIGTIDYVQGKVLLEELYIRSVLVDATYGQTLVFWCQSLDDDFIGNQRTFPVFEIERTQKEFIDDNR